MSRRLKEWSSWYDIMDIRERRERFRQALPTGKYCFKIHRNALLAYIFWMLGDEPVHGVFSGVLPRGMDQNSDALIQSIYQQSSQKTRISFFTYHSSQGLKPVFEELWFIKWDASFGWSFHPNSICGSKETTVEKTHPKLWSALLKDFQLYMYIVDSKFPMNPFDSVDGLF